jgi:hypothetical protein
MRDIGARAVTSVGLAGIGLILGSLATAGAAPS